MSSTPSWNNCKTKKEIIKFTIWKTLWSLLHFLPHLFFASQLSIGSVQNIWLSECSQPAKARFPVFWEFSTLTYRAYKCLNPQRWWVKLGHHSLYYGHKRWDKQLVLCALHRTRGPHPSSHALRPNSVFPCVFFPTGILDHKMSCPNSPSLFPESFIS